MVVFLPGRISAASLVPAVKSHLPQAVPAPPAYGDPPRPQQVRRHPDAVRHSVVRPHDVESPPPQRFDKAGRRRVRDDPPDVPPIRQALQIIGVFGVGPLPSGLVGIVIVLRHPIPDPVPPPPESERRRICRPVIHRHTPLLKPVRRRLHRVPLRVEKVVHQPLGGSPLPQHEPAVKHPGISPLIPGPDGGRQRGIIRHGEVQAQRFPLLRLQDPLLIKPVLGPLRIAVEPQPASRHAAPGHGLLHKGPGHQRRLIHQDPRQRTALDQRRAGLVPAAEEQIAVFMPPIPHHQQIFRPPFPHGHSQPPQPGHQLRQQIPPQSANGLPAKPQLFSVEPRLGPQEKGRPHGKGLAAAHRAVADDSLPLVAVPPCQDPHLLGGKMDLPIHRPRPPPSGRQPLPARGTAPPRRPHRRSPAD